MRNSRSSCVVLAVSAALIVTVAGAERSTTDNGRGDQPSSFAPADPDGDCSAYTSCHDCTSDSPAGNCGWCADFLGGPETCWAGTASGPAGHTCNTPWRWDNAQCTPTPSPSNNNGGCSVYSSSCDDCNSAPDANCGWCPNYNGGAGGCFEGSRNGPTHVECHFWHFGGPDNCPTPAPPGTCRSFTKCSACTGFSSDCGWCSNQNQCKDGSTSGPNDFSCSGSQWTWQNGVCPAPKPNSPSPAPSSPVPPTPPPTYGCAAHSTSCTACVNSPSGHCGFCATSETCASGDFNGPTTGSCPSSAWDWYSSDCKATEE